MASVNLLNLTCQNNPAAFADPFVFEITFECYAPLAEDLEWKIVYVGSADSTEHDQELQDVLVGPVPVGMNRFVLEVRDSSAIAVCFGRRVRVVVLNPRFVGLVNACLAATSPYQSEPPELLKVPEKDRVGVTAVIVTSSYREKEWLRVGYYVNNELKDMPKEGLPEGFEMPVPQDPALLTRNVLVDQPRVTRFPIDWN